MSMNKILGLPLLCGVLAAFAMSKTPSAQTVPLMFQTTFNCPEWDQSVGLSDANVCGVGDGISGDGAWTTIAGSRDQVTIAANNPYGAGGRGFRHWRGDGLNNQGGGLGIYLPSPVTEMWMLYYVRFQSGFRWGGPINTKDLYWNRGAPGTFYFGFHEGVVGSHVEDEPVTNRHSSITWSNVMHGSIGDGFWHSMEIYAKMNTGGTSNGVFKFWVDGTQVSNFTDVKFSNTGGAAFTDFALGSNQNAPANGKDMYTDYDDIAVSTVGYITPVAGPPPPSGPQNLRIIP